jgi:type IV pilus secretin PilQ/predicted competence protein
MKMRRRIPIVLVAVGLSSALLAPAPSKAQTTPTVLSDVTVSSQPDSVTVHVKTSREPKYRAELLDSPSRLVIDLDNTVYAWRKTPLPVGADPVKQIRGSQYRKGVARVVFELTRNVGYAIREEADGLAIVIPTAPVTAAAPQALPPKEAAAAPAPAPEPAKGAPEAAPAPARVAQAAQPAQPTPAPANGSHLISFDFKDADVVNLLRILAAESGKNIVIGEDVKGKMSITLRNVPWDLAFQTVLDTKGLQRVVKDGVIRIVSTEQLIKEREAQLRVEESKLKAENDIRTKAAEAKIKEQEAIDRQRAAEFALAEAQARGPLTEEAFRIAYADPGEVVQTLQSILGLTGGGTGACRILKDRKLVTATGPGASLAGGPPPIAMPPFSALYGTAPPPAPGAPTPTPTAEVLAKGITIQAHCPTNSIFIRHYETQIERIKKLIREKLDVPLPQVKIEARMNELNRTDFFALGVSWGGGAVRRLSTGGDTLVGQGVSGAVRNPGGAITAPGTGIPPIFFSQPSNNPGLTLGNFLPISALTGLPAGGNIVNFPVNAGTFGTPAGIAFGFLSRKININLVLDALEAQNKTTSLAKPELVTVENAQATITLGSEIPYATVSSAGTVVQFKEALLSLDVTPTIIREPGDVTRVKMIVNVENNSQGALVSTTGGDVPSINKRTASTQVIVKEGETLAIGGIRQRQVQENVQKVPFLGNIPIIGFFFRSTARTTDPNREMVVFITPYVLKLDLAQTPPAMPQK